MSNRKKIIILAVLLIVIIIGIISLFSIINSTDVTENEDISETIDNSKYDELKDSIGKGHSKDVVDVKQDTDADGNRKYTFITSNGNSTTVTVRKKTDDEIYSSNVDNPPDVIIDEDNDDTGEDEKEEDYGTAFEVFMNMNPTEQSEFYKSFESPDDFYAWFDKAEEEYKKLHPTIVVGEDEVIDFGH